MLMYLWVYCLQHYTLYKNRSLKDIVLSMKLTILFLGICICDQRWTGEDCSTDLFGVPHDLILSREGLCDRSERLCEQTIIYALGLSDVFGNSSCRLREFLMEVCILYPCVWFCADSTLFILLRGLGVSSMVNSETLLEHRCKLGLDVISVTTMAVHANREFYPLRQRVLPVYFIQSERYTHCK